MTQSHLFEHLKKAKQINEITYPKTDKMKKAIYF